MKLFDCKVVVSELVGVVGELVSVPHPANIKAIKQKSKHTICFISSKYNNYIASIGMTLLILACSFTLVVSFFCSLSEAVLYSITNAYVESLVREGKRAGLFLSLLKKDIDKPITAILTVNTVANTAGAAVAGALLVDVYGAGKLGYFTAIFTTAILLFSEIIPKTIGVTFNQKLALVIVYPLRLMIFITMPIAAVIRFFTRFILPRGKRSALTKKEIVSLASLHRKEGNISVMEENIIGNVLELKEKRAADIMTPRTVVLSFASSLTVNEAREIAGDWVHSRVPVFGKTKDDIVGVVFRRDVHSAIIRGDKSITIDKLMRSIHLVPESIRADKLLKDFLERREHLFGVVDEYGGFSGVVTLEDVLEEMIGREIIGEFDKAADMSEMARRKGRRLFYMISKQRMEKKINKV